MGFGGGSSTPAPNSITTAMIQAGAVTTSKIAAGGVTLAALASGLGTPILLSDDDTETTGAITNASVKSFALPINTYTEILIEAEVGWDYLSGAGGTGDLQWDILVGGLSQRTMNMKTGSTSGFTFTFPLRVIVVQKAASTLAISVTVNGGTVTWRVRSLRVWGIL